MAKDKDEIGGEGADKETTQSVEPETTPETEAREGDVVSLSSKEHKDLVRQAKAASELGRTVKTLSQNHAALKSSLDDYAKRYSDLETNFKTFRDRDREAEVEKYKDDTGMMDVVRLRHKTEDEREQVKRERSEFDKERTQHQTKLEAMAKREAEDLTKDLAAESGLTATLLLQIGTDTTDGKTTYNLDRIRQIAKSVPKGESEEAEEEGKEEENIPAVRGQRSRAAGAGSRSASRGLQTMEDYDRAYNEGKISATEYGKARERFGVAY